MGDYYSEGQQIPGQWFGKGAEDLGLSGATRSDEFVRLCENFHPKTGERLTLRQKAMRVGIGADGGQHESANRRVFYDFTFSPPKSVSIAALVGGDARIVEAHAQAVTAALEQLELFASTRVRKNGQCTDRSTGNIVAAVFRHETSRALDPHLHICATNNIRAGLQRGNCCGGNGRLSARHEMGLADLLHSRLAI